MKETEAQTDPRYDRVREAFSKLDTQDKAAFVLEATFDTLGQAFHDVGKTVGDAVESLGREDFFDDVFRRRTRAADGPGAAEPPTAASTGRRPSPPKPDIDATPSV